MSVFVVDKQHAPLMPCTEKRARLLLSRNKAVVISMYPFTIRLKYRVGGEIQKVKVKIDPGSKFTGIAVVRESESINTETGEVSTVSNVLSLFQLNHRGAQISANLKARSAMRRRRRGALRYRPARFDNRTKPEGWLAPSLQHRVDTTMSWVSKLQKLVPVSSLSQELVKFDMQLMRNPEISGVEYQQGELQGYEVREYLLEKWNRQCAYCSAKGVPLQIEHIHARAKGGSNSVTNLAIACEDCNIKKGTLPIEQFLKNKPDVLKRILAHAKRPLRDAAAVNSTRNALATALNATGLPVELATGGKTKYNRVKLNLPKSHALDAACVGTVDSVLSWNIPTIIVKCTGRGAYQRTRLDKFGFPRGYLMQNKYAFGFKTGDMVKAIVPSGVNEGVHSGRVAIRASGRFDMSSESSKLAGISYKHCKLIARGNGYGYLVHPRMTGIERNNARLGSSSSYALSLPALKGEVSRAN